MRSQHKSKGFRMGGLAFLSLAICSSAAEVSVQSGPAQTHLIELYTSEGCSSCPPAERRLSALRQSPRLWKEIIPVAFHVDYWDSLGWPDKFASAASSDRQRAYAASWRTDSIYTPEFVLDGKEWRGRSLEDIQGNKAEPGLLSATLRDSGEVTLTFQPASGSAGKWEGHAALLSLGVSVDVKRGENAGRTLAHDFVVISHLSAPMAGNGNGISATMKLPADKIVRGQSALAVWITEAGKLPAVQAAGGPL